MTKRRCSIRLAVVNPGAEDPFVWSGTWGGDGFYDAREFRRLVAQGVLPGYDDEWDSFQHHLKESMRGTYPRVPNHHDPVLTPEFVQTQAELWEPYTREFIKKNKLKREATRRAWGSLSQAQELAYRHLDNSKKSRQDIEKRMAEVTGDEADPARAQKLADLAAQREKLLEPMSDIFNSRLKGPLERLIPKDKTEPTPAGANQVKQTSCGGRA